MAVDPRHPSQVGKVVAQAMGELEEYITFAAVDDLPWQAVFEQDDLTY